MTQRVIDYAWNGPPPAAIAAAGFVGAIRYLSHSSTKNLTAHERDALRAKGLAIGLVWETSATRPRDGAAAGRADAVAANQMADALGVPDDVCIYFACDSDQTFGDVRDYYAGARAASKRPTGCYGGSHVFEGLLKAGAIVYAWQSESRSFSDGTSPNASIIQIFGRFTPDPGGDWDENHVLKPDWGQWPAPGQPSPRTGVIVADVGGVTPAPIPVSPLEDEMPARIVMIPEGMPGHDGVHWVTNGITAAPIATPDDEQWLVDWLGAERDPNGNPLFVRPSQLDAWKRRG